MVDKKYKDKPAQVAELQEQLGRATAVVVTEYRGLKAGEMVKLRRSLGEGQIELKVVKNTLLRRASDGTPLAEVLGNLSGPSAVALAFGEPTDAAKRLSKGAADLEKFVLGNGYLEGAVVTGDEITAIAKLPSKLELQSQLVGTLEAPLADMVGMLEALLQEVVGILDSKIEKDGGAD